MGKHRQECKDRQKHLPVELRYKKSKNADILESKTEFKTVKGAVGASEEGADFYIRMAESELAMATDENGLVACRVCGRTFQQNRIVRHEGICFTASQKRKRKPFKSASESRVEGTDFEAYKGHRSKVTDSLNCVTCLIDCDVVFNVDPTEEVKVACRSCPPSLCGWSGEAYRGACARWHTTLRHAAFSYIC
jgi:hypothetical protein